MNQIFGERGIKGIKYHSIENTEVMMSNSLANVLSWVWIVVFYFLIIFIRPAHSTSHHKNSSTYLQQIHIWNMARELGVEQNCNAWILHYDAKKNDSWKHFYQMVAKNHSQIGYFGVNDISQMNSSRWISPSNGLTLNLYLSQNWVKLNQKQTVR